MVSKFLELSVVFTDLFSIILQMNHNIYEHVYTFHNLHAFTLLDAAANHCIRGFRLQQPIPV